MKKPLLIADNGRKISTLNICGIHIPEIEIAKPCKIPAKYRVMGRGGDIGQHVKSVPKIFPYFSN